MVLKYRNCYFLNKILKYRVAQLNGVTNITHTSPTFKDSNLQMLLYEYKKLFVQHPSDHKTCVVVVKHLFRSHPVTSGHSYRTARDIKRKQVY